MFFFKFCLLIQYPSPWVVFLFISIIISILGKYHMINQRERDYYSKNLPNLNIQYIEICLEMLKSSEQVKL
jgi:hypothetical protein